MRNERIRDLANVLTKYHNEIACKQLLIVMVNSTCQVLGDIKVGDIYFAEYFPTNTKDMTELLEAIDSNEDVPNFKKDSKELITWFYNKSNYMYHWGMSDNRALKVRLFSDLNVHNLLSYEYDIISQEKLDELVNYGFYEFHEISKPIQSNEPDNKKGFTFTDEDQRDIYGSALLDGATPTQAWAIATGLMVDADNITNVEIKLNGFFRMKKEYVIERRVTRLRYES
jgi:hypothetical protein